MKAELVFRKTGSGAVPQEFSAEQPRSQDLLTVSVAGNTEKSLEVLGLVRMLVQKKSPGWETWEEVP